MVAPTFNSSRKAEVPSATSLPQAPQDDQQRRMRNYVITMSIRTICFIAAVLSAAVSLWLSLAFFVGAAVLPYIAVVFANATGTRRIDMLGAVTPEPPNRKEIHGPTSSTSSTSYTASQDETDSNHWGSHA